jgi:hypothetical protein
VVDARGGSALAWSLIRVSQWAIAQPLGAGATRPATSSDTWAGSACWDAVVSTGAPVHAASDSPSELTIAGLQNRIAKPPLAMSPVEVTVAHGC